MEFQEFQEQIYIFIIITNKMDASITLVVMQPTILLHGNKDKDTPSC